MCPSVSAVCPTRCDGSPIRVCPTVSRTPRRGADRTHSKRHRRHAHRKVCVSEVKNAYTHGKHVERSCRQCRTVFNPRRVDQVYCSTPCRSRAKQPRRSRNHPRGSVFGQRACQRCSVVFTVYGNKKDQRYCSRSCYWRTMRYTRWQACSHCGDIFDRGDGGTKCRLCRRFVVPPFFKPRLVGVCVICGDAFFAGKSRQRYCSRRCWNRSDVARSIRHAARVRRRTGRPADGRRVRRRWVFERDDWTCQLCRRPIDREAEPGTDWSASIDHIVPVSRGGEHTIDNVQCAHLRCNRMKGASIWVA